MKVLSRKPMSKAAGTGNNVLDLEQPTLDDEEEDDEDESQRNVLTMEERQRKAQREREDKQKKYEEARQRLFGSEATGGAQSPSRSTLSLIQQSGEPRSRSKTKGSWDSRPPSVSNKARQLYDPNYTVKPDSVYVQKKEHESLSGRSTPIEQQPIRSPRGPDNTGRGGFGFAARGSKSG